MISTASSRKRVKKKSILKTFCPRQGVLSTDSLKILVIQDNDIINFQCIQIYKFYV